MGEDKTDLFFLEVSLRIAIFQQAHGFPAEVKAETLPLEGRRELWKGNLVQFVDIDIPGTVHKLTAFYNGAKFRRVGD